MKAGSGQRRRAGGIEGGERRRRRVVEARADAGRDLLVRAAGLHRRRVLLGIPARDRLRAGLGDQEPGLAVVLAPLPALRPLPRPTRPPRRRSPSAGADEREPPGELLAREPELELTGADGRTRVPRQLRLEGAPVPADRVAGAVLALRDDALEVEVLDRVVLGPGGEAPLVGVAGRALRDGPRGKRAVDLQAKVVVEAAGTVPVDDEAAARRRAWPPAAARPGRALASGRSRAWLGSAPGASR